MAVVRGFWPVGVTLALTLGGCSGLWRPTAPLPMPVPAVVPPPSITGAVQTGVASWYGPGFHGKRTSNGEVYNQYELTAAHPTLPLGSRVMVTNLNTRQSIEVRVNDRGPFVGDRVIDLSYAAARSIGVYDPGTAPVRIEVLSAAAPTLAVSYAVQLGSYADADKAAALKVQVIGRYPDVYISPMATGLLRYYQVRLGPFTQQREATTRAQEVARAGMQAIIVEEDDRWAER
ncbi:MAG: septal ring lytic transglycosylase RlpA family protein [Deltaproteobacteria bacterium]|nr:septal ring lytic transglycosylase RlpA family protein [Deltaproteobacteria bacterium]